MRPAGLINPGDIAEMLQRRTSKIRPNKFSTMLQKVGFFEGFEKSAGIVDSARNFLGKTMPRRMAVAASEGNITARANTVKNTMSTAAKDTRAAAQEGKAFSREASGDATKIWDKEEVKKLPPSIPAWKRKLQYGY